MRFVNPLSTGKLWQTVKTDEKAAFHQGLHCLPRQNQPSENEIQYFLETTCDPSIHKMDHPDFIVCNFMEKSIGLKVLKEVMEWQRGYGDTMHKWSEPFAISYF